MPLLFPTPGVPSEPPSSSPRSPASRFRARLPELFTLVALATFALSGCNDTGWPDRDPVVIDSVGSSTLTAWPPLNHALTGETLRLQVGGLKTVYDCARVLSLGVNALDTGSTRTVWVDATVELPATPECPLTTGLDTLLETSAPASQKTVVLRTLSGTVTDSVFVFSGTAVVESFLHMRPDTVRTFGRYRFRDSTAGHPRRILFSDSLAACETIQAAVFTRRHGGDTLSIAFRTLLAAPALPATTFKACAGMHADTVTVVENRYGYP
jgi:hypothetical protein